VAAAKKDGSLAEAKCLAATITDNPEDNGECEAILSKLCEFDPDIAVRAIVEELPRLKGEGAHDRMESLVETEARFRPEQLAGAWAACALGPRAVLEEILQNLSVSARIAAEPDVAGDVLAAIAKFR
jgi:hypothetical protein